MSIVKAFVVPHPPLIIPEVGKGEEKGIQNTIDSYNQIACEIADIKPDTVIVISPHSIMYQDYIHISPGEKTKGDLARFGTGQVKIDKAYDSEFVDKLSNLAESNHFPAGTLGEKDKALDHGTMVPLYFIEKYYHDYRLVRISISGLSFLEHYQFGKMISETADTLGKKTVIIASGDLSHKLTDDGPYGYAEEGPEFDKQLTEIISSADFIKLLRFDESFCEKAGECGLRSFIEMAGALDGKAVKPEFLSYEGPFGVGYAVFSIAVTGKDENRHFDETYQKERDSILKNIKKDEDQYVRLARSALETYISSKKFLPLPSGLPDELVKKKAGVFVSLKKDGRLRGCIGTISATTSSIAQEIINNAVNAGTEDPRFTPITKLELPDLVYSVDVLCDAEPVQSISQLDAKRYGVIVSKGYRRGLLLPNLDGVDTPEEQLKIALQKAGISQNEEYSIERFEVVRHK